MFFRECYPINFAINFESKDIKLTSLVRRVVKKLYSFANSNSSKSNNQFVPREGQIIAANGSVAASA